MKTTQEKQGHARTHKTVSSLFCRTKQDRFMCAGFSTLELLMAFVVLTLSLTAVIMLVFGNQSMAIDTELAQRGVYLAEQNLEESGIIAQSDFHNVTTTATTTHAGTPYSTKRDVLDISPCAKQVTDEVFWKRGLRNLSTKLSSIFVSTTTSAAVGGNCSSTLPSSNWDTPETYTGISASDFDAQGTGVDVASINGTRYAFLTTNESSSNPTKFNFYWINTDDPESVIFDGVKLTDEALNGIEVGSIGGDFYAFVLRDSTDGQLQVVDLSSPESPTLIASASSTLPNVTPSEDPTPRSIYYHDEKVYIGTEDLAFGVAGFNEELHVYDVSSPSSPSWEQSIEVGRNVNDIFIHDGIAYLATGPGVTSPYTPLKIFDIASETEIGEFGIGADRHGTAVYKLGDTVYLGLSDDSSEDDFYVLDVFDPTNPVGLGAAEFPKNHSDVSDIVVQGPFAFIGVGGTNSQHTFQVWNVSDPDSLWRVNPQPCVGPVAQELSGLVYRDDLIFGSFRSSETFRIIYDTPDVCTP